MPAKEKKGRGEDFCSCRLAYGALAIVYRTAAISKTTGLTDVSVSSFILFSFTQDMIDYWKRKALNPSLYSGNHGGAGQRNRSHLSNDAAVAIRTIL